MTHNDISHDNKCFKCGVMFSLGWERCTASFVTCRKAVIGQSGKGGGVNGNWAGPGLVDGWENDDVGQRGLLSYRKHIINQRERGICVASQLSLARIFFLLINFASVFFSGHLDQGSKNAWYLHASIHNKLLYCNRVDKMDYSFLFILSQISSLSIILSWFPTVLGFFFPWFHSPPGVWLSPACPVWLNHLIVWNFLQVHL